MGDENLTPQVRKKLSEVDGLLRRQSRVEKARGQWVEQFCRWCDAHNIELGLRLSGKTLLFDRELIKEVDEVLDSQRLALIGRLLSGKSSAEQAKEGLDALPVAYPLRDYLTLLLGKQRGLKQQWFGGEVVFAEIGSTQLASI